MEEKWVDIDLYNKKYKISDMGKIRNKDGKILKGYKSSGGYLYICIRENGHNHHLRIHRLVAKAFIPNPNNLLQVNHINGNKLELKLENPKIDNISIKKNLVSVCFSDATIVIISRDTYDEYSLSFKDYTKDEFIRLFAIEVY